MFNSNTVLDKRVIKLVKYRMNSLLGSFEINNILFFLDRLSECPYEIIVSPIRPMKKIPRFLP